MPRPWADQGGGEERVLLRVELVDLLDGRLGPNTDDSPVVIRFERVLDRIEAMLLRRADPRLRPLITPHLLRT